MKIKSIISYKKIVLTIAILVISTSINFSDTINKDSINIYLNEELILAKEIVTQEKKEKIFELEGHDEKIYVLRNIVLPLYEKYKENYKVTWKYNENKEYIIYIYEENAHFEKIISEIKLKNKVTIKTIANYINKTYPKEINPNYEFFRSNLQISNPEILKAYSTGRLKILEKPINEVLEKNEIYTVLGNILTPKDLKIKNNFNGNNIPILMYHEINDLPTSNLSGLYVSRENFVKQLDYIKDNGYNTITMEQFYNHKNKGYALPSKPIILTFDDGYKSHIYASNELNKRGLVGTFYIIGGKKYLESPSHVNEIEILKMHNIGMEIGSHTLNHVDVRYVSKKTIEKEYKLSKEKLESIIGSDVNHFCYPIGANDSHARETLKNNNYKTAVTTKYSNAYFTQKDFSLKRIRMFYDDKPTKFDSL